MTDHTEPDLHGMVAELTETHVNREKYAVEVGRTRYVRHHITMVPALVQQLLGITGSVAGAGSEAGSAPTSKPAVRVEAIDTVMLIDDEAGEWIDRLGGVIPADQVDPLTQLTIAGAGTVARLRRLHGLHPSADRCRREHGKRDDRGLWCCAAHQLEHDVRRWWQQARIITGWGSPAYRPFNTCPECEHRGGLRINIELRAGVCIECKTIWSQGDFDHLVMHIRIENDDASIGA